MKNLSKLYVAIKDVEEKTLFELDFIDEENEVHFFYYKDDFKMIVSSESIYIDPEENCVLLSYTEMCALMELMRVLKEFN